MLKKPLIYIIKLYQRFISPILGQRCRFFPTCSSYAIQAIDKYGVLHGGFLSIKRILKCHPLHPGGYNPLK